MAAVIDPAALAELNQVAYRYAAAVDACDEALFVSCFWPDGRLRAYPPGEDEPFSTAQGHAALAQIPTAMRPLYDRTAHLMTNHLIEVDGETATGSLLCTARHLVGDTCLVVVIRYVDRYERRQGEWRIADRRIRFLWTETHPASTDASAVRAAPAQNSSR